MAPFVSNQLLLHSAARGTTTAPQAASAALAARPATAIASSVVRSATVATVNPAIMHMQVAKFRPILVTPATPRDSVTLPTLISPTPSPTDATLFQEPEDPARRHFLPVYGIAATSGSTGSQKWVSLSASDHGFELDIHLTETTSTEIASNIPIYTDARYLITASLDSQIVTWDLTAVTDTDGAALKLTLRVPDFQSRDRLYRAITDPASQARLILRRALPVALPDTSGLYRVSTVTIDTTIPFTFSRDLDSNVFAQLGAVAAGPPAKWKVQLVNWSGRGYPYYQSAAQPDLIYFLPDAFKIARQAQKPHAPALSVATSGADASSLMLTLSYLAQPVWDPRRIEAAEPVLQQRLSLGNPPSLALFQAADAQLFLSTPSTPDSTTQALVEQTGALVDIAGGIQGAVSMNLEQFRQVYDALFDPVSQLLSGEVRVTVDGDVEKVPFVARASDFLGDIFRIDTLVVSDKLTATLTNAIESPIHIEDLKGCVMRNGRPVNADVVEIAPPPPLDLRPSGNSSDTGSEIIVTFAAAPAQGVADIGTEILGGLLSGKSPDLKHVALDGLAEETTDILDSQCTPLFDFSKTKVVPDPKALWNAIMQDQQVGPVIRPITLKLVAAMLAPYSAAAPAATMAIQIVFENGQTVDFDASQQPDAAGFLTQSIKLAVPIDAFVLGNADTRTYRYHINRITAAGTQTGDWVNDNRDVVYIVTG